ncbi:MAG: phage portal protein [Deltaproteobacteria bacterium]|nr:phage portal protein [Deltaproteobacteria bacterium]
MGIFASLLETRDDIGFQPWPRAWLTGLLGGEETEAGNKIDEESSLSSTAVWAAVTFYGQAVGGLPLKLQQAMGERRKRAAREKPLYNVLQRMGNSEMTAMSLRETLQAHALLWGTGYAEKEFNGAGDVVGLWPLNPALTRAERNKETGELQYRTRIPSKGIEAVLPARNVFRLSGFSLNGLVGLSPIQTNRDAIGLGKAMETYGSRFFSNGARPAAVLKHPGAVSDPAKKNMRESWQEIYGGLKRSHRIAILEEGVDYQSIADNNEASQFLEGRTFQVVEAARIFNVSPYILQDYSRATFSNVEHAAIHTVVHSLRPWFVRWEQAIEMQLLSERERAEGYFVRHIAEGLLRGDTLSRYRAYAIGRNWGWLSANDVRDLEDQDDIGPSGDLYLIPGNMTLAEEAGSLGMDEPGGDDPATEPTDEGSPNNRAHTNGHANRVAIAGGFRWPAGE